MQTLGRYELGRVLGEGGAGRVVEATLVGPGGLRKPVAVKVLLRGGDALRREARIGGLLRHRNLVDVYEVGEQDGTWFCAMERCAGSLFEHRPLPPRSVVEVGVAVCEALQYAHEELGLVHLDLKPENLLFSAAGIVKVADLGIARAEGFESDGRIRGTRGFMAPEQLRGAEVDAKADVYALAKTLLDLAGCSPSEPSPTGAWLQDATADQAHTLALDEPAPMEVPPTPTAAWLERTLEACLAPSPFDRPTMGALAAALRALQPAGHGLREHLGLVDAVDDSSLGQRGSLAQEPNAFIGRQAELQQLAEALTRPGALTLKGPAGVGKSRLAAAAARRWIRAGHGAAYLCALAEARSVSELAQRVAEALQVPLGRGDPVQQLGHALASRGPVVVVLDGFEHLSECVDVVERWLGQAPEARFLVTSRVAVGLAHEQLVDVDVLGGEEARALVVSRALSRGVELDDDADLAELADRLDGLPLALELAAGRLGVLSVRDVLDRLELKLLRSGQDDRHGTLEAALEWSWELLQDVDHAGLTQLSVFRDGFTVEAAEAVLELPDGEWAVDVVERLLQQSWLFGRDGRLGMLSAVRAFTEDRLANRRQVETRHGSWYAEVQERSGLRGSRAWMRKLQTELDNLMAACRRAIGRRDGPVALSTLEAAWEALVMSGPVSAALPLAEALGSVVGPMEQARCGLLRGRILERAGRVPEALVMLESALQVARKRGDRALEGMVLGRMAGACLVQSRPDESTRFAERALVAHRAVGDRRSEGVARGFLGINCRERGDMEGARRHQEAALAIAREVGDRRTEGVALTSLGNIHRERGNLAEGEVYYKRALDVHRAFGNRRSEGLVLGNLGNLARERGRIDEGMQLAVRALDLHNEVGSTLSTAIELGNIAALHVAQGNTTRAGEHYDRALRLARQLGHRRYEGHVLGMQGVLHRTRGEVDLARPLFEEAIAAARETKSRREEGVWRLRLASLEIAVGRIEQADAQLELGEARLREVGDEAHLAELVAARVEVCCVRGDRETAQVMLSAAEQLAPEGHAVAREAIARARAVLSE
ncbi:MAG: tetratricopeptide repeat protein [Proteobacteria bacterium]|nr:tetratricopeptide repeat protein [Pseudomonadota bacterium]